MCTSNSLPAIPFLETFSSGDCVQCTLKSSPRNPLPTSQHFRQRKQVAIFCTYPPTFAFSAKEGKLPAPRSWVLGGSWWKAVQRQIMVDCVWCFDSVFGTTYTHTVGTLLLLYFYATITACRTGSMTGLVPHFASFVLPRQSSAWRWAHYCSLDYCSHWHCGFMLFGNRALLHFWGRYWKR